MAVIVFLFISFILMRLLITYLPLMHGADYYKTIKKMAVSRDKAYG